MDVKSLILDETELTENTSTNKERVKNTPVYKIDVDSGCDFAVTKTQGRSTSQLVCLISQRQFYMIVNGAKHVFTFASNGELSDSGDKRRLTKFLGEYDRSLKFADNSVIYDNLPTESEGINNLIKTMCDNDFLEAAKSGDAFIDLNGAWFGLTKTDPSYKLKKYIVDKIIAKSPTPITKRQALYNNCSNVLRASSYGNTNYHEVARKAHDTQVKVSLHYHVNTRSGWYVTGAATSFFEFIESNMGFDNAKYVIDKLFDAYAYEPVVSGFGTKNPAIVSELNLIFDKYAFCNYVIYNAISEGWENYSNFFDTWFDTLNMEQKFYGKIKEKYPKNLATYHNVMNYKNALKQKTVNEAQFRSTVEKYVQYEYTKGDYSIIIPKTSDEVIDEAIAQSNCLRSYIEHVANGHCCIAFLRRKAEPLQSFVTIEIKPDKAIGQVYAEMNKIPDGEALAFVKTWAKAVGLEYSPDSEEARKNLDKYIKENGEYAGKKA